MNHKNKRYMSLFVIFIMFLSLIPSYLVQPVQAEGSDKNIPASVVSSQIEDNHLRIHFDNGDKTIPDLGLWLWGDVATPSDQEGNWPDGKSFSEDQITDFGPYLDIELTEVPKSIGMNVLYEDANLLEELKVEIISEDMNEVWITEAGEISLYEPVDLDNQIRIHYFSENEIYEPWGVWSWGNVVTSPETWPTDAKPFSNDQIGNWGAYIDLDLMEDASQLGFVLVNMSDGDEQTDDMTFDDIEDYDQIFVREGDTQVYTNPYFVSEEEEMEYNDGVYNIKVNGKVASSLHYNKNALLSVNIENTDNIGINEVYADLSELGGSSKVEIVTEMNELSIAVRHDIEVGTKNIPITVIDKDNGIYNASTTVEVVSPPDKVAGDFDWDEAIIYFMLTDRFYDGNENNNDPYDIGYDNYENNRGTYQGGDFAGITKKLDYLDDLGVNTIWINPIVENIGHDVSYSDEENGAFFGYHGYWASDFEKLNPHLGTLDEFHTLIDKAANRDMKIMVDVVLNHSGYGLKADDNILEAEQPVGYPTNEDRDRFTGLLRDMPGNDDLTSELSGLPDFSTEDPAVRDLLIDWQTSWLERSTTENGNSIAYFRVDTVKHVDDSTWQQFKNELTREMPEFKMIGESFGANANNDHGYLNSGMMDSLLDFDFKNQAGYFVKGELESVNAILEERNLIIDNTAMLGQFLGSHDEDGFLSHHVGGDEGMLKVAAALQVTAKGQPVIYYGEELGQSGANNWPVYDNRYDLDWDSVEDNDILEHYQKVIAFRGDHSEVFARGERSHVAGSDEEEFLLFERDYDGERVYVGLNVSEQEREVTVNVDSNDTIITDSYNGTKYEANENQITVNIPAMADGGTALLTVANGDIVSFGGGDDNSATLRVHYKAEDNDYSDLGLWVWGDVVSESTDWPLDALQFADGGITNYGSYVDVNLIADAENIGMKVNNHDGDNVTNNIEIDLLSGDCNEIWITESGKVSYHSPGIPVNTLRVHNENDFSGLGRLALMEQHRSLKVVQQNIELCRLKMPKDLVY